MGRTRRRLHRLRIGPALPIDGLPGGDDPTEDPTARHSGMGRRRREGFPRLVVFLDRRRRLSAAATAAVCAATAAALGGAVAAVVAATYGALGMTAFLGLRRERRVARDRAAVIDSIATLAADLRAGLAPDRAIAEALPVLRRSAGTADGNLLALAGADKAPDRSVAQAFGRLAAAWQLSERLGAPLAELLDRVEADLRSAERTRTSVAGQTAGARATTWLLAALPVAGVGLGYGMGVDPARSLLHTPLGAGCALGALGFQCAGLAWSAWLTKAASEQAGT
jgi:tight adherence protein B